MYELKLKHATSEVARWANNLPDDKKEKLVAISRERLRRRYVGRTDLQEAALKWSNADVVAALVTHVSDSCTMELLLDLYVAFCTFEEGIFKELAPK